MLSLFLDGLTREQKSSIEVVTADAAKWIEELLWRRCPNARWVMDPLHVVEWINDALERVRRDEWQAARQADRQARAAKAQGAARAGKLRERAGCAVVLPLEETRGDDDYREELHLLWIIGISYSVEAPLVAVFALTLQPKRADKKVDEVLPYLLAKHVGKGG